MFVCVSRVTLDIPAAGSLKAKRQVLRRVTDRVKAKFNVSVAEVDDQESWQRGTIAAAVVGNDRRHVNEQMEKIIHFVEEMYVAPIASRELEIIGFGDQLYSDGSSENAFELKLEIPRGDRSLAEAEGLGDWDSRHGSKSSPSPKAAAASAAANKKKISLEEARTKARNLRNPRDWEKP